MKDLTKVSQYLYALHIIKYYNCNIFCYKTGMSRLKISKRYQYIEMLGPQSEAQLESNMQTPPPFLQK